MSGSSSPMQGHFPVTVDDRAMLLPPSSSAGAAADRDTQAKSSLVDVNRQVYTITDDSLPSHMRSLLPTHEKHVHDLLTLERTRKRLRYVIIGLTVMLALTVLVAVALVFSIKVTPMAGLMEGSHFRMPSFPATGDQMTKVATEVKVALLGDSGSKHHDRQSTHYTHSGPQERRTPCVTECWSYAAFRFRSVCQYGFCRCYGEDYDTDTCLPKYHNCSIEKKIPRHSAARLSGKNQTTYVCHVPAHDTANVHVISIFGNHRAPTTQVTVKNQSPSSAILVLVNYHFVKWTVDLPTNSGITQVVIVSMKRSNQAKQVVFLGAPEEPEVVARLSVTGYGEDKYGGHTPRLLHFLEDHVGPLASFLGASHADHITLDLSHPEKSTTMRSTDFTTQ